MRSLLTRLGPFIKGFLGAIVGVLLVLLLLHAWYDHKALHDIVNMINANATKLGPPPK